mgnify:CR=1 FL=1
MALRSRLKSLARSIRPTSLVLAASVGTYLLILTGVSNALAGASRSCSTWPLCEGPLFGSVDLAIVFAHRLTALVVGLLMIATLVAVLAKNCDLKVKMSVVAATLLYPVQVIVGGQAAVSGPSTTVGTLHLVTGMIIFTALMAALVWQLGAESPNRARDTKQEPIPRADPETVSGAEETPSPGPITVLRAYIRLTKPYLWWLLSLVALASMGLAARGVPPLDTTIATITGGVLAIGASATFNNVLERDRDELMNRTKDRPTVTTLVSPRRAVTFGFALLIASMTVFLLFVNVLAAGLGLLAVLFYSVVYTLLLKPNTDQNTVIGGAVGALPALIGWAAVTDTIGVPAIVLGVVVFLWTPAHFYNLALMYKEDYARAGFPMLPVVRGEATTRRHIAGFLGATLLATILLGTAPKLGVLFAAVAVVFGAAFLLSAVNLNRVGTDKAAKRTFIAANAYLGAILFAIMIDTMAL